MSNRGDAHLWSSWRSSQKQNRRLLWELRMSWVMWHHLCITKRTSSHLKKKSFIIKGLISFNAPEESFCIIIVYIKLINIIFLLRRWSGAFPYPPVPPALWWKDEKVDFRLESDLTFMLCSFFPLQSVIQLSVWWPLWAALWVSPRTWIQNKETAVLHTPAVSIHKHKRQDKIESQDYKIDLNTGITMVQKAL